MVELEEEWRPIAEFDGYEVSNLGRVRSWRPRAGRYRVPTEPRIRKSVPHHRSGHHHITFSLGKGRYRQRWVHRMVLEAFVGPCPPGMECCHYDDDPGNNKLDNLRWDTRRGNFADRKRNR